MDDTLEQELVSRYFREGIENYIKDRICTSFAVIIETIDENGEYHIHAIYDEKSPKWRNASLLSYASDRIHYDDDRDLEEDY
jgi:hypothetical protein